MSDAPRTAADILADLQALDRVNDRLEHRIALANQSVKAAEARLNDPDSHRVYLDRAAHQLKSAG